MTTLQPGAGFSGGFGFSNPPIGGGGVLVRDSIHSPNYVPGQSGWSINKDGTAEFFGLTITGGGFIANQDGQFFYAGIPALGNLIMSISGTSAPGVDKFGNVYTPGGMCLIGLPTASALFTLLDTSTPPNTLAGIGSDGSFSTNGTLSTNTDLYIAGQSLTNDILPEFSQGEIARTNIFSSSLPVAMGAVEFYLYELDVTLVAGRSYTLVVEPMAIGFSIAGKAQVSIYATTDGTQPTNASPLIIAVNVVAQGTAALVQRSPAIVHPFNSTAGNLWRFLVSVTPLSTGGGIPTLTLNPLDTNPGDDSSVNARFSVYDQGLTIPNTGRVILAAASGSGGGTQNYTKTYTCTASHSYEGSDGTFPNNKINDNSSAYQGGDVGNTFNGKSKTWYTFNLGTITGDLSGATITKVQVFLSCRHTWYSGGMTGAIGWDNKTSFGSTSGDPAGAGIDISEPHFNEGQSKWVTVPNSVGVAFQNGSATTIVVWKNSNSLQYYGFFSGASQNNPCQLRISYTK